MGKKLDTPYKLIHFVNHSHIDYTWWNSPEVCAERNEEILNLILENSASNPDFKFAYETTGALIPWLEKNPDKKDELSALLKEGRVDVGSLFVSINAEVCCEEVVARNLYFGKKWVEKNLGYSVRTSKEYDTVGHTLQTPQLTRSAGMDTVVISRGPRGGFIWVGPDGSEVLTFCVPYNWSFWRKLGVDFAQTEKNLPAELERALEGYPGPDLIIPDGDDMTLPNPGLTEIVQRWNKEYDEPKLVLATMEEAIDKIRSQNFQKRSGDMPNLWAVTHALQVATTHDMKMLQNILPITESICAILSIHKGKFEKKYPLKTLDECWKNAILVGDHNWGAKDKDSFGVEGDMHKKQLVADALKGCHKILDIAFTDLSFTLLKEEDPPGMPIIAFNTVAWQRTDSISAEIACGIPGLEGIEIVTHEDKTVPFDFEILEKHNDDTIYRLKAVFPGHDLPPLGYTTFYVKPLVEKTEMKEKTSEDARIIENGFYRVEVSEDGSHIKSLIDKELDVELAGKFKASAGPLEFDFGMFELFGIGLRLTTPDRSFFEDPESEGTGESVDITGEIWRAGDYSATTRVEVDGDFSKSLIIEGDFVESKRRQKITLYEGIKRVDLSVDLEWGGRPDTTVYLQMPNTLMDGERYIDVPFAVHHDGDELAEFWIDEAMPIKFKERGMQDWLCFEKDGSGVAVATRWPILDLTLVPSFPLMWTNNNSAFFFGDSYLQKGEHSYAFSLTSYKGAWQDNDIHLWGKQWAKPIMTMLGESAPEEKKRSYLSVDSSNIVITAFKKAHDEDALVVRLFEAAGKKTDAVLRTAFPITKAAATNIIETTSEDLAAEKRSVNLSFKPYEIKTVKLYIW